MFSLPNGCVMYFDEFENLNFGSRFAGEAKLVHPYHGILIPPRNRLLTNPNLSYLSRATLSLSKESKA